MLPSCDAVLLLNGGHVLACIVLAAVAACSAARVPPPPHSVSHLCLSKPHSFLNCSRLALILLGAAADWAAAVLPLSSGGATAECVSASAGFGVLSWTCVLAVWLLKGRGMALWAVIEVACALPHLMVLVLDNGAASAAPIAATSIRILLLFSLATRETPRRVDRRESGEERAGRDGGWEAEAREALLPPDHLQVGGHACPVSERSSSVATLGAHLKKSK